MSAYIIPPAPRMGGRGYTWQLKEPLLSREEATANFYSLTFSPEENALIKEYDTNITKLGLLDTSFLYSIFEKGTIPAKQAKAISAPLTRMKKGTLKMLTCYPFATFKEIEAANPCPWEKGHVMLEAESLQAEGTDYTTAIEGTAFGEAEGSFFQNRYSLVRKKGLTHLFYQANLLYSLNPFESLTNIAQRHQELAYLHLRRPENCCNMFQFTKMLFLNQVLFEKNVFRERLQEVTCEEQETTAGKVFAEKVEVIYKKFEEVAQNINAIAFEFLQKKKIEELSNPGINFQNTHFKFDKAFPGNSRKDRGLPTAVYLTKKEEGYCIYWRKEKTDLKEQNLEEISAFLKFYLTFCAMLQLASKEFFSEMLPENI